ncbi:MAG: chromosome condensation protein CrcB [Firmicutes bacterium]|nr:chromosome condensation protein CrcB [Bacillota bacterium]
MRKYSYIMIGGALGAMLRLAIKNMSIGQHSGVFPLNTLLINISGSFILALFLTMALEVFEFDADVRLGISTGFLGAYTTFSTLCSESVKLLDGGQYIAAAAYLAASAFLGLGAAYLGVVAARGAAGRFTDRGEVE